MSAHPAPASLWLWSLLLAGLATLGPFSIDTYLPSFPAMAHDLQASNLQVQQTLSVYLVAFAVMQLAHGTLSDSLGRRPVILAGLVVFALASVGCALAEDIKQLLAFRALQGLSAGAGIVVGRAIIRDLFQGPQAQRLMSQVTMIFGVAPAVAPLVGGYLHGAFGWHSIFVFLASLAFLLLAASLSWLPETLPGPHRQPLRLAPILGCARMILASRDFVLLSLALGFNFAGFFLYIAAAPVLIYRLLGLGHHDFPWLFVPAVSGMVLGAFLSGRLAHRLNPHATVRAGYRVMAVAAALNLGYSLWFTPALPWAVLPVALYAVGMALAMPSITLLILDLFPATRGLAASLQGFLSTLLNAAVAGGLAPVAAISTAGLALAMAVLLAMGALCWFWYRPAHAQHNTEYDTEYDTGHGGRETG